ncbi:hypothetical protein CHLRE_17g744597v5 [Chlamydomonas reinhardtii]|uniref:Uncharacterized protein n=1 Tax=Chlamydomonas reinhardtii TaxID=3055 RepID=A0A2K3CRZ0_CHLRE|nr:uncharacterized protein CHLRE_17g744597v5 [Chlamydomonas reinhardtii]PNW71054.1 hypothetical protein CHLRE_17g744597v5 [Chlamydomonas reinhardtii]
MQPSQVAFQALDYAQQLKVSIEADAQRKSDPGLRVPADYAFALLALLAAGGLVLGSIALGWWVLWRTTLHKMGPFRDLMGLNKAAKADAKQRAAAEIRALKVRT